MGNYRVELLEKQVWVVFVEAESEDEAKDIAYQGWENGELGYTELEVEMEVEETDA